MTAPHRDHPRRRRTDTLAGAARLEVAVAAMRAHAAPAGPDDESDQPAPPEHPCAVLPTGYHSDGPCGPAHHPPAPAPDCCCASVRPGESCPVHPFDPTQYKPMAFSPEPSTAPAGPVRDWSSRHDPRSREFGVRALMVGSAPMTDRLWGPGPVLDQGTEGQCVGFGIIAALNAGRPGADAAASTAAARALFRRADEIDGDGRTGVGTSVLAGMQAAAELGAIGAYRWCFGTRDVAQAVLQRGPVVVGIPWPPAWFDLAADGLLTLPGPVTGDTGHCLAVVGLSRTGPARQPGPYFVLQNSYGPDWGDRGLGYLHHRDLATLLRSAGEAALPIPAPA